MSVWGSAIIDYDIGSEKRVIRLALEPLHRDALESPPSNSSFYSLSRRAVRSLSVEKQHGFFFARFLRRNLRRVAEATGQRETSNCKHFHSENWI